MALIIGVLSIIAALTFIGLSLFAGWAWTVSFVQGYPYDEKVAPFVVIIPILIALVYFTIGTNLLGF